MRKRKGHRKCVAFLLAARTLPPISPGYSMVNQHHDPRSASRWPAIKRLTEPKCCIFYTSRNSSLCCRPICRRVTMYTWVLAQLSTNSIALQRTSKHCKTLSLFDDCFVVSDAVCFGSYVFCRKLFIDCRGSHPRWQ